MGIEKVFKKGDQVKRTDLEKEGFRISAELADRMLLYTKNDTYILINKLGKEYIIDDVYNGEKK